VISIKNPLLGYVTPDIENNSNYKWAFKSSQGYYTKHIPILFKLELE
jgi:hypothetical protein